MTTHHSPSGSSGLLFPLLNTVMLRQDKNCIFIQSHCFAFAKISRDVVSQEHNNEVRNVHFRRIYFHNFISSTSPFYRIAKDLKDY